MYPYHLDESRLSATTVRIHEPLHVVVQFASISGNLVRSHALDGDVGLIDRHAADEFLAHHVRVDEHLVVLMQP